MQILCPFCSQEKPVSIPCEAEDSFGLCEKCAKRFRLRTFRAESVRAEKRGDHYRYTCLWGEGAERFNSKEPLSLREGDTLTTVRRGRDVLGVADQDRNRWYPVKPPASSHPLLRSLALSLVWPVSVLAIFQGGRLAEEFWNTISSNILGTLGAGVLFALFLGAPVVLWLIRALFPHGPGRERIRGYDPRL